MDKEHSALRLKEASVVLKKLSEETLKTITPKKCQMLEKNMFDKMDSCCDGNNTEQLPEPSLKTQTKRKRQRKNMAPRKIRIVQDPCNDDNSSSEDWLSCRSADTSYSLSPDTTTNKCFPYKHEITVQYIGGNNNANTSTKESQNADKDTTEYENPQISTTPIFVKKTKSVSPNTETYIKNLNKQNTNTGILQSEQSTRTDMPILLKKVTKHKTGRNIPNILSRTKTISIKPSGSKHKIKKQETSSYVDIRPKTAETAKLTAVTPIAFGHIQNTQCVPAGIVPPLSVAFPILHKQICNRQPFVPTDSKTPIQNLVTNQPIHCQADQSNRSVKTETILSSLAPITVNQFPTSSRSSSAEIEPSAPKPHYRSRLRSKSGTQYIVRKDSIISTNIADILETPFRERVQECGRQIVLNVPGKKFREKIMYNNFIKKSGSSDITHGRIAYDEVQGTSGLQGPPVKSQSPIIPTRQESPILTKTHTKNDLALVEQAESIRVYSKGGLDDVKREMNKVNPNTWIINENISAIDNIILPMYINSKRLTEKEKNPTEKYLDNLQSRFMPGKETSSKRSKSNDKTLHTCSNRGIVQTFHLPSDDEYKINDNRDGGTKHKFGIINNLSGKSNVRLNKTIKPNVDQTKDYPSSTLCSEITHGQISDTTHSGNEKGHLENGMDVRRQRTDTKEAGQGQARTQNVINTECRTEPVQPEKTINIKREWQDVSDFGTTDDTYRNVTMVKEECVDNSFYWKEDIVNHGITDHDNITGNKKLDEWRVIKPNDFTKLVRQPQFTDKVECNFISDFKSTDSKYQQQCYDAEPQVMMTDEFTGQTIDITQEDECIERNCSFEKERPIHISKVKKEPAERWPIVISKIKKESAEKIDQKCYDELQLKKTDKLTINIAQKDKCIEKRNSSQFVDNTKEFWKSIELKKEIKNEKISVKAFQLTGNEINSVKDFQLTGNEINGAKDFQLTGNEINSVNGFPLTWNEINSVKDFPLTGNCNVGTNWSIDISKVKKEPAEKSYKSQSIYNTTETSIELNKEIKNKQIHNVKDFQLTGNSSVGTEWHIDISKIKKEPVENTGETTMGVLESVSNVKLLGGNDQAQAKIKLEHNCHDHAYTRFEKMSHLTIIKKEYDQTIPSAAEKNHTKSTIQSTDCTQKPQTSSLSQFPPIPVYAIRCGEKVVLFPATKAKVIYNDLDIPKLPTKTSPTRKKNISTKKKLLDQTEKTQSEFVKKFQLRCANEIQTKKSVQVVRDLVNVNFRSIVNKRSRNNMKHMCAVVVQITRYEDKFSFTKGIIALSFSNGSNPFLIRWHNDGIYVAMVTFNSSGKIQHLNVDRITPGFYSLTLKNDHGLRKNRTYEGMLTSTLPNEDLLYAERDFLAIGEIKNILDPTISKPDVRNFIGINLRDALSDVLSPDLMHAYSLTISDISYRPKLDDKMWYSMGKFEHFTKTYGRKRGFQPINRFPGEEAN